MIKSRPVVVSHAIQDADFSCRSHRVPLNPSRSVQLRGRLGTSFQDSLECLTSYKIQGVPADRLQRCRHDLLVFDQPLPSSPPSSARYVQAYRCRKRSNSMMSLDQMKAFNDRTITCLSGGASRCE